MQAKGREKARQPRVASEDEVPPWDKARTEDEGKGGNEGDVGLISKGKKRQQNDGRKVYSQGADAAS